MIEDEKTQEADKKPKLMELGMGNDNVISVFGVVNDVKVRFLLDTGASHNFLSLRDVSSLGLTL